MALEQGASPEQPEQVVIKAENMGHFAIAPPTFLELWGVWFVGIAGAWVMLFGAAMLWYYLTHLPPVPSEAGAPAQVKEALDTHKQVVDQYRDSLTYIFDLMVTKTMLPLVTLLLGYLFGRSKIGP